MSNNQSASGPTLQFLGAAGTVTGSKYLLRANGQQILIDCGLFQGPKRLRQRNLDECPFVPAEIDAVVLTHAHIDHTGYLPLLTRKGFRGPVICTPATRSLLKIMLPDSAHLQEEEAKFLNRRSKNKGETAEPLYTGQDAQQTLGLIRTHSYDATFAVTDHVTAHFRRAGHILGSANIEMTISGEETITLAISGDIGRWGRPMIRDPESIRHADVLLVESTYGNRLHPDGDSNETLARVINESVERGGALLIPAFAVGRTQEIIWRIRELEDQNQIPQLPVYVDSPMATSTTDIFCDHPEDHDIDMKLLMDEHRCPLCCKKYEFTKTPQESKALNNIKGPLIIIAASGMATGGRIVHHLKHRLPSEKTTVLLVGFQAYGTRGRMLQDGVESMRIYGETLPVMAKIEMLHGLSGHADQNELLRWLGGFESPPKQTFIVHGEAEPAETLANILIDDWGWNASVAQDNATVNLSEVGMKTPKSTFLSNVEFESQPIDTDQ